MSLTSPHHALIFDVTGTKKKMEITYQMVDNTFFKQDAKVSVLNQNSEGSTPMYLVSTNDPSPLAIIGLEDVKFKFTRNQQGAQDSRMVVPLSKDSTNKPIITFDALGTSMDGLSPLEDVAQRQFKSRFDTMKHLVQPDIVFFIEKTLLPLYDKYKQTDVTFDDFKNLVEEVKKVQKHYNGTRNIPVELNVSKKDATMDYSAIFEDHDPKFKEIQEIGAFERKSMMDALEEAKGSDYFPLGPKNKVTSHLFLLFDKDILKIGTTLLDVEEYISNRLVYFGIINESSLPVKQPISESRRPPRRPPPRRPLSNGQYKESSDVSLGGTRRKRRTKRNKNKKTR